MFNHTDASGVDEQAIALAFVHDFRVAGDDLHAALLRRIAHRTHHTPQCLHRETFFDNESAAQIKRPRAAHREIIHRAVNRHRADVAAGKEQRTHDVGIGRHGKPARRNVELCRVMARVEDRIAERLAEHVLQQLMHQLPAAPVRHQNVRILLDGQRTTRVEVGRVHSKLSDHETHELHEKHSMKHPSRFGWVVIRALFRVFWYFVTKPNPAADDTDNKPRTRLRSKPSSRRADAPGCNVCRTLGIRAA
jgi:hypothetical protein